MTKLAMVTAYDSNFAELASITLPNMQAYALKHDFPIYVKDKDFSENRHPAFEKIYWLKYLMLTEPDIKWFWWLDADALITNFSISALDFLDRNYDIVIAAEQDFWHCSHREINTGSFFIRNSEVGMRFLDAIISLEPEFKNSPCPEQDCAAEAYHRQPEFRHRTKLHSLRAFNSLDYDYWIPHGFDASRATGCRENGQWQQGDFIMHWAGINKDVKIANAKLWLKKIKY